MPQSKLPSRPAFPQTEGWGCPEQAPPKKQGCPRKRTRPGPPKRPQSKLPSKPVFPQTEGWGCPEQAPPKKQGFPRRQDPSRTTKDARVEAAFQARIPPNRRLGLPRTPRRLKSKDVPASRTRPGPPKMPKSKLPSRPVFPQTEGWGCPEQASPKRQGYPCTAGPVPDHQRGPSRSCSPRVRPTLSPRQAL